MIGSRLHKRLSKSSLTSGASSWMFLRFVFNGVAECSRHSPKYGRAIFRGATRIRIHLEVLDELGEQHDELELTSDDKQRLNSAWHRMDVWEDVPAALIRLRERYVVSILTVLSLSIVVDSSKHAGIDWDAYLSCEFLGVYKPEPEAYQKAARLFGVEPSETMMVACHPPDLAAAQRAGLKAAHVKPKVWEMGSEGDSSGFEIQAESYTDLADQLCG